jgi:hypothetical protein
VLLTLVLFQLLSSLGERNDWDAVAAGVEVRDVPTTSRTFMISSYGTIDGGYELMRMAWPKMLHKFAVRRNDERVDGNLMGPPQKVVYGHHRYPTRLLKITPVDLLIIERGYLKKPTKTYQREEWEHLIEHTVPDNRPMLVLESWPASAQSWMKGPMCKSVVTRWEERDYSSRCKLMNATRYGGTIDQSRLMVV